MNTKIFRLATMLLLLLAATGCNDTDDAAAIFTSKVWKLNFITLDGRHEMWDFWGNEAQRTASLNELRKNGTYNVVFEGVTDGNQISGNIKGSLATGQTFEGTWSANAQNRDFHASVRSNDSNDILATRFVEALNAATAYEGDSNNLYLLYKPTSGSQTFRMVFFPVANTQ